MKKLAACAALTLLSLGVSEANAQILFGLPGNRGSGFGGYGYGPYVSPYGYGSPYGGGFFGPGVVAPRTTPAPNAPIATKLMCPNESTPELPMKT